jgi:hypothetical protein
MIKKETKKIAYVKKQGVKKSAASHYLGAFRLRLDPLLGHKRLFLSFYTDFIVF